MTLVERLVELADATDDSGDDTLLREVVARLRELEGALRALMSTTGVNEDDPEKGYVVWWVRRSVADSLRVLSETPPR